MSFSSEKIRERVGFKESRLREPGTVLFSQSRYEIVRTLGEGGMGVTCLADEYSTGNMRRPVVLKFVKDSLNPERLAQFLNEVQLSVLFQHPNLVPIHKLESETLDVKKRPGLFSRFGARKQEHIVYYAVMQYIDGWNLREIVNRLRQLHICLNHDMTLFIIGRVARGLQYVHQYKDERGYRSGLVHRDISPENILVDRFGRIKVADFGLTRPASELRFYAEDAAGKLLYCSPEQLDGRKLDARSDIYNLGLLLYFLFTNVDRFSPEIQADKSPERVRGKMQRSALEDLEHVSPRLAQICERCLRENPDERYDSCDDLATDIDIYFKEAQKVVTNEQLEDMFADLFSRNPRFISRRYIPLTGSAKLDQPDVEPSVADENAPEEPPAETIRIDNAQKDRTSE